MDNQTISLIGKTVPQFTANCTTQSFTLSQALGQQLVLYFYPKDNTPGCTQETAEFRDAHAQFSQAQTQLFGISRDSLKSHQNFKAKLDLPFDLISDPDEQLCALFNVMKMKNMYGKQVRGIERSTFLIDRSGVVRHEWRGVKVTDHVNAVLAAAQLLNQKV